MSESLKVLICGDGSIGKTCLLDTLTGINDNIDWDQPEYRGAYRPTASDTMQRVWYDQDGDGWAVNFWDTVGQEAIALLPNIGAYPGTEVLLIGFDMTKGVSLENLQSWRDEVADCEPNIGATIVVGTKSDLYDELKAGGKGSDGQPLKTLDEMSSMAVQIGAQAFVCTSAKTGYGTLEYKQADPDTMSGQGEQYLDQLILRCVKLVKAGDSVPVFEQQDTTTLTQPLDQQLLEQRVEWQNLGEAKPAIRKLGYNKSSWARSLTRAAATRPAPSTASSGRSLSMAKSVAAAGGSEAWNTLLPETQALWGMLDQTCKAHSTEEALADLRGIMSLGHNIWAYSYMRVLYKHNINVFFGCLMAEPAMLMPVVYTPTVGEACQKFGIMPFYSRGCYVSITDRGNFTAVLEDYASSHLGKNADGTYACDCIVFSDGGRILGLGDLGAWGMGIPIGKLDLYTTCAGVNPHRTMPVIIDAGIYDKNGNTAKIDIRDHPRYTGLKQDRVTEKSAQGTTVNSAYYGEGNMIDEFMSAACTVFGQNVLLQFEDFNSNDAFPLLETYRTKYVSYNDDIQGTAAVTCAGILGSLKIKHPAATDLLSLLQHERVLLHGSGSANLGAASLLSKEGKMPLANIAMTNSRGLMWKSADGSDGTFRNDEQKEFSVSPQPAFAHKELVDIIENVRPTVLVGATGRTPNCFDQAVIEKMMEVTGDQRPVVFALSNPKTQAEITAQNAYTWSNGEVIFGSGTKFASVTMNGKTHSPGMVNNVYIFPGMSFGAIQCSASTIPDSLFLKAAEAVANSLTDQDIAEDRVMPPLTRIREVSLNVATAVVLQCQKEGIARKTISGSESEIKAILAAAMWTPDEGSMTVVDEPQPEHCMGAEDHTDEHDTCAESVNLITVLPQL